MTGEQKIWLDGHRAEGWRIMGNMTGGRWARTGMLHADGTFEEKLGVARLPVRAGSFEVGVFEAHEAPGMRGPG